MRLIYFLRSRKWGIAIAVLMLYLVGVGGGVAAAHGVYQVARVYESELPCVTLRSELNHTASDLYLRGDVQAERDNLFGANCMNDWDRPTDYIRVRYVLQKQNISNPSTYSDCVSYLFTYNTESTDNLSRNSTIAGTQRPCGAGSYRTLTIGAIRNGNDWFGGDLSSLNHLF